MDAVSNVAHQFGVYWSNLIAQVILFMIVYWVLSKFAFKPVIADAQTKYEEILAKANAEAQRLIEEGRANGARLAEQKHQEAIAEAEQITNKAKEAIMLERDRLMAEMKQQIGRLVIDTTARVTGKVLTADDHQRINEETVRQIAA